jgi:glycolate oxidase FAD binding subunit
VSIRAARTEAASKLAFGDDVEVQSPASFEELSLLLEAASASQRKALIWGGGTHQGIGFRVEPDLVILTRRLNRLIDWEPDDLTVVVEAGVTAADLELELATRRQTCALTEAKTEATVGGLLAAGVSGYRRARYGPVRDRVLEVTVVTGDGRLVRGGGRVVKNVTGYDLPRLVVGAHGSMGVIVSTCLKLWPLPAATATVTLDPTETVDIYRPLAVLDDGQSTRVYLGGTEAEIKNELSRLRGDSVEGLFWPSLPESSWQFSLRVPPASAPTLLKQLPRDSAFLHQVGVGEVAIAAPSTDGMAIVREAAEGVGGALVVTRRGTGAFHPWGTAPASLGLQRRLIAAFDPARVLNPGRLPGGL